MNKCTIQTFNNKRYIYIYVFIWRSSHFCMFYRTSSSLSCHGSFLLLFILLDMMENFTLLLIILSNSRKNSVFSSDLCLFMYHFVIKITKLIRSRSSLIEFGMPNNISHSHRFNFKSISLYSQFSTLSHIDLLITHWYRWCSSVSMSWQKLHLLDCLMDHFASFSLVFKILLIILYWKLWRYGSRMYLKWII